MNNLQKQLKKLDLKDSEIKIYLTLLSIGKAGVSEISRKTSINRTTAYSPLESLSKKGLIFKTTNKKRILYSPENPKKIISILNAQKRELDSKQKRAEKVIPELENLFKNSFKKPRIRILEGKSGLLEAYEEISDSWQNIYSIFSPKSFFSLFSPEENDRLLMKLKEKNVRLYNFIEKSDQATKHLEIKKYQSFVKNKPLPDDLKFSTDLLVTQDKLALISFESMIAVIIYDKAIADMQKKFLKFIWKNL